MKIEMGESLFYSWLRHVKECQVVQTNWKVSPQWTLNHEDELEIIMQKTDAFFEEKAGYKIYKKNASLSQIIQQGECDALGTAIQNGSTMVYAVDVAFHESGLNYGSRDETIMKIINKCIRTAMCIYGFMDIKDGEIIFASPKINPGIIGDATQYIEDTQRIFDELGFGFAFRIIANEEFKSSVLEPILLVSKGVADTNELFIRSYQMLQMFDSPDSRKTNTTMTVERTDGYKELKIGRLARTLIKEAIESGKVGESEIGLMQTKEYSKERFDIQFPALVAADSDYDRARYYQESISFGGREYKLTSQWYETKGNNDRPYLIKWLDEHGL